jgi:hypothetical protein
MSRKRTSEPPHVGCCRIENGLAGWQIVPTPLAQFIRDSIVSPVMTKLADRGIVQSLIAQFAGNRIVAALRRQFMSTTNRNWHEPNILPTRRQNLESLQA